MTIDCQFKDISHSENAFTKAAGTRQDDSNTARDRLAEQNDEVPWETQCGSPEIFYKALKIGRLRGIVIIAECMNPTLENERCLVHMAQELIQRDILVLVSDCIQEVMSKAGLMEPDAVDLAGDGLGEFCDNLDIQPVLCIGSMADDESLRKFWTALASLADADISNLPMTAIASKHHLERTNSTSNPDTLLGLPPNISGDATAADTTFSGPQDIYDTFFLPETIPTKAADLIDEHIHVKRLEIKWCDRYHCSIHS